MLSLISIFWFISFYILFYFYKQITILLKEECTQYWVKNYVTSNPKTTEQQQTNDNKIWQNF